MNENMISKETVVEILLWAKDEKHIRGDLDLVIQTIMNYENEK